MPQHVRGDNLEPVRPVHLGGHADDLEQAATSGLAVSPASCLTTTTEPGQVMALNNITLVLDLADGTGTPLAVGQALLNPSAQFTDATPTSCRGDVRSGGQAGRGDTGWWVLTEHAAYGAYLK